MSALLSSFVAQNRRTRLRPALPMHKFYRCFKLNLTQRIMKAIVAIDNAIILLLCAAAACISRMTSNSFSRRASSVGALVSL
ncbi:hypothetical protein KC365_g7 [Hortaea werneckii]|nr:hypothetical protein KC339_g7 [Hortaea werneckii]KAI7245813.1 hypothetical protein KC365_g7 [Hortaea werneckii]